MISFRRLAQSFTDAFRGIRFVFKHEQNFRIQIYIFLVILGLIIYLPLRSWETILLILLSVMVMTMELLNTALEYFTDLFKPRIHPYVGIIKDIMAGATFLTSMGALVIGCIILYPYFLRLFE